MADFGAEVELETFRGEARAWLEANFPTALKGKAGEAMSLMDGGTAAGDLATWRDRLADKGWTTPTWPTEYGGGGLSVPQARVLEQEMGVSRTQLRTFSDVFKMSARGPQDPHGRKILANE